jgi:hypothetical protein
MFRQLFNLIQRSRAETPEPGHYQMKSTTALDWQPLDVSRLNLTSERLRQIEATLAEKTRAEFAAVTRELNGTQSPSSKENISSN